MGCDLVFKLFMNSKEIRDSRLKHYFVTKPLHYERQYDKLLTGLGWALVYNLVMYSLEANSARVAPEVACKHACVLPSRSGVVDGGCVLCPGLQLAAPTIG